MQLEFSFVTPIEPQTFLFPKIKGLMTHTVMLDCFTKIFNEQSAIVCDGPSFPLSVLVGERGQFEFPFAKEMEKSYWSWLTDNIIYGENEKYP